MAGGQIPQNTQALAGSVSQGTPSAAGTPTPGQAPQTPYAQPAQPQNWGYGRLTNNFQSSPNYGMGSSWLPSFGWTPSYQASPSYYGAPQSSSAYYPLLNGGYFNQMTQALAGPGYTPMQNPYAAMMGASPYSGYGGLGSYGSGGYSLPSYMTALQGLYGSIL